MSGERFFCHMLVEICHLCEEKAPTTGIFPQWFLFHRLIAFKKWHARPRTNVRICETLYIVPILILHILPGKKVNWSRLYGFIPRHWVCLEEKFIFDNYTTDCPRQWHHKLNQSASISTIGCLHIVCFRNRVECVECSILLQIMIELQMLLFCKHLWRNKAQLNIWIQIIIIHINKRNIPK